MKGCIMSEYTKGPWKHADAPEGCSEQIYAPQAGNGNGGLITVISSGVSKEEDIANAHLISAAPDMYEELRASNAMLLAVICACREVDDSIKEEVHKRIKCNNKALAKAEGRE